MASLNLERFWPESIKGHKIICTQLKEGRRKVQEKICTYILICKYVFLYIYGFSTYDNLMSNVEENSSPIG
jgi:hypothetical protein